MLKSTKRTLTFSYLLLLVFLLSSGTTPISLTQRVAAPYLFSIPFWEARYFPEKWVRWVTNAFSRAEASGEAQQALVHEYFAINHQVHALEQQLQQRSQPTARAGGPATQPLLAEVDLRKDLLTLEQRQTAITPRVEEIMEAAFSTVLREQGVVGKIGPTNIQFPPVDIHLGPLPKALAISERSSIKLVETDLLRGDMTVEQVDALEKRLEQENGTSAYVASLLGVATYPAIVRNTGDPQEVFSTICHEWLHHYFAFHPLGQHFYASNDLRTMNETSADMGGGELAVLVMQRLGFPAPAPSIPQTVQKDPSGYSFIAELRKTRQQVEVLLSLRQVDEAEKYMEERRQEFAAHGYYLRKLNQAFFAFQGNYADSGASISPIQGQLQELRAASPSLSAFLHTVAGFDSPDDLSAAVHQIRVTGK
ncbi:MAG: hypothetical protein EXR67_00645 [Dehalococcoidia bacterium]|nr:hypothetical protein [Dehalococcoidia bacterium]